MKIFSFFSGIGFLDLGFENAGFEIVYVNEIKKSFLEAYKYSRQELRYEEPKYGYDNKDIQDLHKPEELDRIKGFVESAKNDGEPVGFIGGPPCPDFSIGGKNRGRKGDNGILSGTYIDLITLLKPDFFLFENVKGLWRTKKHREFYEELKRRVAKDFVITDRVVNAIEYAVPQDRDRIILFGANKEFLEDSGSKIQQKDFANVFPWEEYIKYSKEEVFKLNWPTTDKFKKDSKRKFLNSVPKELTVQHWFDKNEVDTHPNAEHHFTPRAAKSKFEVIEEGDDSGKSSKRLHRWRYSPTAAYGNNEVHLHPYKVRRLSAAESLAIQSLPQDFSLPREMTLTDMFKGIGNGVPYLASLGLAKTIKGFIEDTI